MIKEKSKSIFILIPLTLALMCFWLIDEEKQDNISEVHSGKKTPSLQNTNKPPLKAPASVPVGGQNPVSQHTKAGLSHPVWKERVEKTLFVQAAGSLKKVEIETVDSFPWKMGKVEIPVDSIKVKLIDKKGQRSSFRAIVDASSGKILQTWDHPVIDNFEAKNSSAGIRIDSRYHND